MIAKGNFTIFLNGKVRRYKKGDTVNVKGISTVEIEELKDKDLVSIMDTEDTEDYEVVEKDMEIISDSIDDADEFLSMGEIQRLKNKSSVVEYGKEIGMADIDEDDFSRDELNQLVYDFIMDMHKMEIEDE